MYGFLTYAKINMRQVHGDKTGRISTPPKKSNENRSRGLFVKCNMLSVINISWRMVRKKRSLLKKH